MSRAMLSAMLLGVDAAAYNEDRAVEYAKLAGAAYCSKESLLNWDCGHCSAKVSSVNICQGSSIKGFVGIWEGKPIVSFEGTDGVESTIRDLETWHTSSAWSQCDNCKVHDGFLKEYESFQTCVKKTLTNLGFGPGSKIRTTGHSLGAAVSGLAMVDLTRDGWIIEESYDFGKPRTGDHKFAAHFNDQFQGRAWRVTRSRDPVPLLPPAKLIVDWHFEQVYPEVYYHKTLADGFVICTGTEDCKKHGVEQYGGVKFVMTNALEHLHYMDLGFIGKLGCKKSADAVSSDSLSEFKSEMNASLVLGATSACVQNNQCLDMARHPTINEQSCCSKRAHATLVCSGTQSRTGWRCGPAPKHCVKDGQCLKNAIGAPTTDCCSKKAHTTSRCGIEHGYRCGAAEDWSDEAGEALV